MCYRHSAIWKTYANAIKNFSAKGGYTKAELFEKLNTTVTDAVSVIRNLKDKEMLKVRSVQGYDLSAIGIILHVVEHYS